MSIPNKIAVQDARVSAALGSDERIRKYRHADFTDKPIERCVLLAP